MRYISKILVAIILLALLPPFTAQAEGIFHQDWAARTDITNEDFILSPGNHSLAIDAQNNVYLVGYERLADNWNLAVVKYGSGGDLLWIRTYDNGNYDVGRSIALDALGNAYVTGESSNGGNFDFITIKYDPSGNVMWTARFDGSHQGNEYPDMVIVGQDGSAYVGGSSWNGANDDAVVVKYDPQGQQEWVSRFNNGGYDRADDIIFGANGSIYAIGSSYNAVNSDFLAIKINPDGQQAWVRQYDSGRDEGANILCYDAIHDAIIVSGFGINASNSDYLTIKYDNAGNTIWESRYDSGYFDNTRGIVADSTGNVYVTGSISSPSTATVTVKYDPSGNEIWTRMMTSGHSETPEDIAIDPAGDIYVAATATATQPATDADYILVKYGADGTMLGQTRYDSGGGDAVRAVKLDAAGNVYLAGTSVLPPEPGAGWNYDFLAVKYSQLADTMPPEIDSLSPTNNATIEDMEFTVEFSVNDPVVNGYSSGISSVNVTLDGQAVGGGQTVDATTLLGGEHALSISATDNAGNNSAQTNSFILASPLWLQQDSLSALQGLNLSDWHYQKAIDRLGENVNPEHWSGDWRLAACLSQWNGNSAYLMSVDDGGDPSVEENGLPLPAADEPDAIIENEMGASSFLGSSCGYFGWQNVLLNDHLSVISLQHLLRPEHDLSEPQKAVIRHNIDEIVKASELLAQTIIKDGRDVDANDHLLDMADAWLISGRQEAQNDNPNLAIWRFATAWHLADQALGY